VSAGSGGWNFSASYIVSDGSQLNDDGGTPVIELAFPVPG